MPKQIYDIEKFRSFLDKATECRTVRKADKVKIKIRTPKMLYVLVTSEEEAEKILKDVKVKIIEF